MRVCSPRTTSLIACIVGVLVCDVPFCFKLCMNERGFRNVEVPKKIPPLLQQRRRCSYSAIQLYIGLIDLEEVDVRVGFSIMLLKNSPRVVDNDSKEYSTQYCAFLPALKF